MPEEVVSAQALADEIARWAGPQGITQLLSGAQYAYALAALADSDYEAAYHQAIMISPAGKRHPRRVLAAGCSDVGEPSAHAPGSVI